MKFDDFIREGKVKKAKKDTQLAKSLLAMSNNHFEYLEGQEINDKSCSSIMVLYYEALRELIEAICINDGFKVYSHEAFTCYLKEKGETKTANEFDRFRMIRNSINYYGKAVNKEEVVEYRKRIIKIIAELKNKYFITTSQ